MARKPTTKNTTSKKAPSKKAATKKVAAKKKATSKKAVTKKAPSKKGATKKKAPLRLEDPDKLKPIVHKPRLGDSQSARKKVFRGMAENVRDSIEVLSERSKKRPVKLLTPAMLRKALMPFDEIYFQYMVNSIGIRTPTAIEIVAPEKVGATTFVMDWISRLFDMGCYSIYCECENKQMDDKRIKRLMDRDPETATMKLNAVEWAEARTLAQLDETIRKTVPDLRKRCDSDPETKGNPIFFFVDVWGALMSKGEAKGNSTWGLSPDAEKEQPKDTTDGSNFEHAKHAQAMTRWLPSFMKDYNCTVVFVNKQNDKIEMQAMPSYMTPSPLKNDTRIGGRALKRLCAYRLTMLKVNDLREKSGEKRVYGHNVRVMLVANSYGPRDRTCEFSIYFDCFDDAPGYLSPGMSYDERTAAWLASKKFLGTTVEKGLYTCDVIGCVAVPAKELMDTLRQHPDKIADIGSNLGLEGYAHEVIHLDPEPESDSEDGEGSSTSDEEPAPPAPDESDVPPSAVPV